MVRVITQATYDEVVKENMVEFDMSPEDAINEAITQFEAQGVDLSNIIKDLALGSGDTHLVSTLIANLKSLTQGSEERDKIWLTEIELLKHECEKDLAHRVRAGEEGAYNVLVNILTEIYENCAEARSESGDKSMLVVLNCIIALMDGQPDLLEIEGVRIMKKILDNCMNEDIITATVKWMSTCCIKHEMNRQNIFACDIVPTIKNLLKKPGSSPKLLSETLSLMRKFSLDDDIRVAFGKAHDHTRELGIHCLDTLVELLEGNTQPPLVSELMLTIASLLVRNELCAAISHSVDTLREVLTENYDSCSVTQQAYKLITALAGNDDVKRKIINAGMAPIIVSLMNRHANSATASSLALKCVTALSLREPTHCRQLLDCDVHDCIVQLMKMHPDDCSVQKNAACAIRNLIVRCKEDRNKFIEIGAESLLNAAYRKFGKEYDFEIKSALRDLECDVTLDEQWKGTGVQLDK